ncbi:hypothetical protein Ahia01_000432000 [Argonauta hians]
MNSPAEEIVLRHPPVASKMTILPSEILPDPDLQLSPFKKGILRKTTHRHKSQSNVRFDLRKHPITDLSVSASESIPADPSLTSNGSDTITDPGWSNIGDSDPTDLCWRNSTNGTIVVDPDLRSTSNRTPANTNCGSSCNGTFTNTIWSNTNNNAVIIADWNNTKNTKSANPTLTSANNGAPANTGGPANPNVRSANTGTPADPSVRGANTGGPVNPNVRSANTGGPANPNVRSANTGGSANPNVRSANTGGSANPNVRSANTGGSANPNVRRANTGGSANPNVRSANTGTLADPSVRSAYNVVPANPNVRSTNNTTNPANPSWHNNGYHGNPPVTEPDNWNNTYNGRLADLNRNSTTNGTIPATTVATATTIPSAAAIPAGATNAVWNTRTVPMPSGDPDQISSYSRVPVDPASISNGYPGTSLADPTNSSSDPTQAAALPAPALPQVALNSSQHILRKLNAFTHTSDAQLIKELHRQLNVDKKKEINEKAAAKVDYKADSVLYDNLISLDVPVVCVKKKKKKKSAVRKKGAGDPAAPVAPFYDPSKENTHQEVGHLTLQGIPPPHVNLLQAPPSAAFTLYKHNRVWDNLPFHHHHHH